MRHFDIVSNRLLRLASKSGKRGIFSTKKMQPSDICQKMRSIISEKWNYGVHLTDVIVDILSAYVCDGLREMAMEMAPLVNELI